MHSVVRSGFASAVSLYACTVSATYYFIARATGYQPSKLFPSIWRVLVSGVWVEMGTFISKVGWLNGVGFKVKKVEKVGFAVHRASFVFFRETGQVFG